MKDPADQPQAMAAALEWVSRIFAVSAEMILPGLLGKWLGERWGFPYLVLPGFALGICFGMWHLIAMTRAADRARARKKPARPDDSDRGDTGPGGVGQDSVDR